MSNKVPNGWKQCKLGEVATIKTGQTNSVDAVADGVYPLFDRSKDVKRSSKYLFDCEAVIVPGEGKDFVPRYYKGKFDLHQRAYAVIPNEQVCDGRYCYYALLDGRSYFSLVAVGSTVMSLRLSTFESFDILLPPLPEQRAIASVLSSLDDKIDLLQRENKTLEAMAETLFRQWFIEEAKDEWEEVPLSEVFDFKEGPGIRNWQYKDKGIPFINIRLISNGEIDVSKANFIDAVEANEKYNHFYLQRKDMVVSTSGTLGKTAIIRNYHLPLLLNTSVIRFRPKDGINYSFMYGYLKSRSFYECLMDSASGSVQLNFGPMHLKQIIMQIPPKEKLENFRKIADPIYEKIELNYFQIHTLEKLRDTLLPKLMSGEVRVKYEEEEMASCRA